MLPAIAEIPVSSGNVANNVRIRGNFFTAFGRTPSSEVRLNNVLNGRGFFHIEVYHKRSQKSSELGTSSSSLKPKWPGEIRKFNGNHTYDDYGVPFLLSRTRAGGEMGLARGLIAVQTSRQATESAIKLRNRL